MKDLKILDNHGLVRRLPAIRNPSQKTQGMYSSQVNHDLDMARPLMLQARRTGIRDPMIEQEEVAEKIHWMRQLHQHESDDFTEHVALQF